MNCPNCKQPTTKLQLFTSVVDHCEPCASGVKQVQNTEGPGWWLNLLSFPSERYEVGEFVWVNQREEDYKPYVFQRFQNWRLHPCDCGCEGFSLIKTRDDLPPCPDWWAPVADGDEYLQSTDKEPHPDWYDQVYNGWQLYCCRLQAKLNLRFVRPNSRAKDIIPTPSVPNPAKQVAQGTSGSSQPQHTQTNQYRLGKQTWTVVPLQSQLSAVHQPAHNPGKVCPRKRQALATVPPEALEQPKQLDIAQRIEKLNKEIAELAEQMTVPRVWAEVDRA